MAQAKLMGRNASARKYDILTALGVHACRGDKHLQRLVLRLITLIVARYNWQSDELCVGQREIAQLWSVDERTVKREMARLREIGWLTVKAAAARGRVTVHGLDLDAIVRTTEADWAAVGPDYAARMRGTPEETPAPTGNVVPFPRAAPGAEASIWDRARHRLAGENAALCAAWFDGLKMVEGDGDRLHLKAPTRFHADYVMTHHMTRLIHALRSEGVESPSLTITA